ncbi:hypothetical protein F1654_13710 [Alkalicaulis satelles]|uniref:Uncharacterized protein n=1 Tax=Alkalicaulis satelles TaxID=2609175 RepID=A0A5M6Z8E3_9PROT|nr:hypothetical protein [Alkalicaulis satelles]KAA5800892.1 hypothetical protein F1654_13710 [Alkalicaulis satelles]
MTRIHAGLLGGSVSLAALVSVDLLFPALEGVWRSLMIAVTIGLAIFIIASILQRKGQSNEE